MDAFSGSSGNPLTLNKYNYANSDPSNTIDPSGHFGLAEFGVTNNIRTELSLLQVQAGTSLLDAMFSDETEIYGNIALGAGAALVGIGGFKVLKMLSRKFRKACPGTKCIAISSVRVDHIIRGGINSRENAVGWHSRHGGYDPVGRRIVGKPSAPGYGGVYSAKIEIWNGKEWVQKAQQHTFFPDNMSPNQILSEIRVAYLNALRNGPIAANKLWTGKTSSGFEISGRINSEGRIMEAYPVLK